MTTTMVKVWSKAAILKKTNMLWGAAIKSKTAPNLRARKLQKQGPRYQVASQERTEYASDKWF